MLRDERSRPVRNRSGPTKKVFPVMGIFRRAYRHKPVARPNAMPHKSSMLRISGERITLHDIFFCPGRRQSVRCSYRRMQTTYFAVRDAVPLERSSI